MYKFTVLKSDSVTNTLSSIFEILELSQETSAMESIFRIVMGGVD